MRGYTLWMNLPLAKFSAAEFLAWEAAQSERHTFYHGEVFAMAGAGDAHNVVAGNLFAALHAHLRGKPCRVFMSDMRLEVAHNAHYTYPDVFVTYDERDRTPAADTMKRHPVFICEVLSASSVEYDRGLKFAGYRAIPTVQEVLFVHPERRTVELFTRSASPASPDWNLHPVANAEALTLTSIGLTLPAQELFTSL